MTSPTLTIGALSAQSRCTVPTILYYEQIGLLPTACVGGPARDCVILEKMASGDSGGAASAQQGQFRQPMNFAADMHSAELHR